MTLHRCAHELVYQLDQIHEPERMARALSRIEIFMILYQGATRHIVMRGWALLRKDGFRAAHYYDDALEMYVRRGTEPALLCDSMGEIANLLELLTEWDEAILLRRRQWKSAIAAELPGAEAEAVSRLGCLLHLRGEYDEALDHLEQARLLFVSLGDRLGASDTIGSMGAIYRNRGDHDRALEYHTQKMETCLELNERGEASVAIGNVGSVCRLLGEYDRALDCYTRQLAICEELGNRQLSSVAIGNMGVVFACRGEFDRALESHTRQLALSDELGDRVGVSVALGNIGSVFEKRGEYDRAFDYFESAVDESREIGFQYGVTTWLASRGKLLLKISSMSIDTPDYLQRILGDGLEHDWRDALRKHARADADECGMISHELKQQGTLYSSRLLHARIDAAEGKDIKAARALSEMLEQARGSEQKAELHYWLLKHGLDDRQHHRDESLRLYQMLYGSTKNYKYTLRIEELTVDEVGS